ncbi:MAG TPA: dienelactone hydrolase family protein [Geobacteraceae bacterium]
MKKALLLFACSGMLLGGIAPLQAAAAVTGKNVEYTSDGVTMKGYVAWDPSIKGKRPGILVVHEWWGLNDYVRKRADMLAGLGYTALALDMYGGGKQALHPDDAGKFSSEVMKNMPVMQARFNAALDLLKQQPTVDPARMGAIGYCFGGGVVLNMARQGVDLAGVVSFHGSLATAAPAQPGKVRAKILVLNGAADTFITPAQIEAFKEEMTKAGAQYRFISYPDAKHAFTNPEADDYAKKFKLNIAYNREADVKSWAEMKDFFRLLFSGRP